MAKGRRKATGARAHVMGRTVVGALNRAGSGGSVAEGGGVESVGGRQHVPKQQFIRCGWPCPGMPGIPAISPSAGPETADACGGGHDAPRSAAESRPPTRSTANKDESNRDGERCLTEDKMLGASSGGNQ